MHYDDVIMGAIASLITSLTIVYSTVYSEADQRKHQSSASLAVVWGIHRGPVNSPHKWPVTRKMFPFDDVIMVFVYVSIHPLFVSRHNPWHFLVPWHGPQYFIYIYILLGYRQWHYNEHDINGVDMIDHSILCHAQVVLTHWGQDEVVAILQVFWNAFSWMKMYEFQLIFHWHLSLRVQLTIFQHWFR